ncbi:MAG TPA: hypothetical protein VNA22_00760, partial [Pyrinomonadaceae bacterium]|nr:hypothetical protein [Pyrinomonadaceae bacterium]
MEQLNQYLQMLVSSAGYELRLEPNRNPYMVNAAGESDVATTPLAGTQISMMVFPLIPPDVKQDLPNQPQIQFVHPHNLGQFSFTIQKSPAGFNVTVRPMLGSAIPADVIPVEQPQTATPHIADSSIFAVESSSVGLQNNAPAAPVPTAAGLEIEDRQSVPRIEVEGGPAIEVISVNDPQFQTVFSDTSTYEPPGRRQDFEAVPMEVPSVEEQMRQHASFAKPAAEAVPVMVPEHTTVPADVQLPQFDRRKSDRRRETLMMTARMDTLFNRMAEFGASDLHLSVSMPPMIRKDGKMQKLECDEAMLTPQVMEELLHSIMP